LDQDLIYNRPLPPPAGRAAGIAARATAGTPLIYTYIPKWVRSSMLSKKSGQKFFWNLENYVANEIVKLLVCSMWGDR